MIEYKNNPNKWIRTITEAFSKVLSAEVKVFEPSQINEARNWLSNAI